MAITNNHHHSPRSPPFFRKNLSNSLPIWLYSFLSLLYFLSLLSSHGGGVLQLRGLRPAALQADILRQGPATIAVAVAVVGGRGGGWDSGDDAVAVGGISSAGADGLRGGAGAGDRRQPRRAELPALRPRPLRAAGAGASANARGCHGSRRLSRHRVRRSDRHVARALHHGLQALRLLRRPPHGRQGRLDSRHGTRLTIFFFLNYWSLESD